MLSTEKKEFSKALRELMALYNRPAEHGVYSTWFNLFEEHPLLEIKKAFAEYAKNEKYPPVPAGVIEYLPKCKVLTAEEAWSHVPKTEYQSGWVTSRMMGALGVAEELITCGDNIGARIAFVKSYNNTKENNDWFYSEAYNVPFDEKVKRKFNDYMILEDKGWMPKNEKMKPPMIGSGSNEMLTESSKKQVAKLRLITSTMLNSSLEDTGKD